MLDHKELISELRRALAHLDDPGYLEALPLIGPISFVTQDADLSKGQALRRVLRLAIDALNPRSGTTPGAVDARSFEVLYRYAIAKQSMTAVAGELGIGERQAYRELQRATEALARILSNLVVGLEPGLGTATEEAATRAAQVRLELERLSRAAEQDVDLACLVAEAAQSVDRLAREHGSEISLRLQASGLQVTANRVMLRQALLNLLSHVATVHRGGAIAIDLLRQGDQAHVHVGYRPQSGPDGHDPKDPYAIAVQLFDSLGIRLERSHRAGDVQISLAVPITRQHTVLIVDDNEDLIALFRRYLRHQPYQVHGATSLGEAMEMLERLRPDVAILDVMMPEHDGWEVLQRLRAHGTARRLRVVVCSIINDPQLAAAMGADAFLNKPVSRAHLLQVLEGVLSSAT